MSVLYLVPIELLRGCILPEWGGVNVEPQTAFPTPRNTTVQWFHGKIGGEEMTLRPWTNANPQIISSTLPAVIDSGRVPRLSSVHIYNTYIIFRG